MRKGGFCLSAAVTLGAALLVVVASAPVIADEVDDAFREGVSAFEQNDYETARQKFSFVLSKRPSDEKARNYRDEAGFRFWIEVLAQKDNLELATIARKILQLAERATIRERQSPEVIQEALTHLRDEDFVQQHEWFERIIAIHGQYVVPYLADPLADKRNDEYRVDVIRLLSRLGGDGVLPVSEILESGNSFQRQNAAVILGNMKDFRAVPGLRRAAENDPDEHTRNEARTALSKFYDPAAETAPERHFLRLAEAYFQEEPLVMVNNYKEWVVWKWKASEGDPEENLEELGELGWRDVPRYAWNEQIAEELLYDSLRINPDFEDAWVLLLNVYFQQWNEVTSALRVAKQKVNEGQLDPSEAATLEDAKTALRKVNMLCSTGGKDLLFKALRRALIDQNSLVAVSIIETIRDLDVSDDSFPEEGTDLSSYLAVPEEAAALVAPVPEEPTDSGTDGAVDTTDGGTDMGGTDDGGTDMGGTDDGGTDDGGTDDGGTDMGGTDDGGTDDGGTDDGGTDDGGTDGGGTDEPAREPRPRRRTSMVFPKGADYAHTPRNGNGRVRFAPEDAATADSGGGGTVEPAVDTVSSSDAGGVPGAALCAALSYSDKRVRYHAAEAFVRLNPAKPFANMPLVVENLSDAVRESGARVIMVVEREQNTRNRIVGLLRELGYVAHGVVNGLEGVNRARAFPAQDLIVVSTELNTDGKATDLEDVEFIERLREGGDYRTAHIPVMILTTSRKQDEKQALVDEGRAVGLVTGDVDRAILKDRIAAVFDSPLAKDDDKTRADNIAQFAAEALASLTVKHTVFDAKPSIPALTEALHGRPDPVRIPALRALGRLKASGSLEEVLAVFNNTGNVTDVRVAAAYAVGEIIKDESVSDATFKSLLSALSEDEEQVWKAAGNALGKGNLTGAQREEVFVNQRIE